MGRSQESSQHSKTRFRLYDVEEVFRGPVLAHPDLRHDYGEDRWLGLGLIRGFIVHVVFTERELDAIRIISLRKATGHERKEFEKGIQDRLEAY
jgi:uncharacterized protein